MGGNSGTRGAGYDGICHDVFRDVPGPL